MFVVGVDGNGGDGVEKVNLKSCLVLTHVDASFLPEGEGRCHLEEEEKVH